MKPVHILKLIFVFAGLSFLNLNNVIAAENTFLERLTKQYAPPANNSSIVGLTSAQLTEIAKIKQHQALHRMPKAGLFVAAEAGDLEAQYVIALKFRDGAKDFETNIERYLHWLKKTADANHAHAQFELGAVYLEGIIVPQDLGSAVQLLIKSANAGDVDGQEKLAYAIENGLGVVKNIKNAIEWYEFAAKDFNPNNEFARAGAVAKLVSVYFDGELTPPDYAKVFKYASLLAQRPLDWYGHTHLAKLFENGLGVGKNEPLALQHYLMALQNNTDINNIGGQNEALYLVGMMYLEGRGTISKAVTAATYFKLDQYNPDSAKQLSKLKNLKLVPLSLKPLPKLAAPETLFNSTKPALSLGGSALAPLVELLAPKKNYYHLSLEELMQDVAAGNVDAQFHFGELYRQGRGGLAKSKKLANESYEKAAQQGHAQAQSYLAAYYFEQKDYELGLNWLNKSLAANNANAQALYALLSERGIGVEKNIQTAIKWYETAAQQFDPNADEPHTTPLVKLTALYFDGLDAEKDYKKVEKYALMLAEMPQDWLGNLYLGMVYESGLHVQKNNEKALEHYTNSIVNHPDKNNLQGGNEALYLVGKMYMDGRGTQRNFAYAKNYFMLDKTSTRAAEALEQLTKLMSKPLTPLPPLNQTLKPISELITAAPAHQTVGFNQSTWDQDLDVAKQKVSAMIHRPIESTEFYFGRDEEELIMRRKI